MQILHAVGHQGHLGIDEEHTATRDVFQQEMKKTVTSSFSTPRFRLRGHGGYDDTSSRGDHITSCPRNKLD